MTIRLLVADDHAWIREGLKLAFVGTEIEILEEATSREEAVCLALALDFDLVLLDVTMPGGDGIGALVRIRAAKSDLPILMYSAHDGLDDIFHCQEAGADGHLRKGVGNRELIDTIRSLAAGGKCWKHFPLRFSPAR